MVDRKTSIPLAILFALTLCGVVHFFINQVQPTAYMDEVFHEDQTLTYLGGRWHKWNPKITTPPGLYVLTTLVFKYFPDFQSVKYFRFLNCFLAGANLLVVSELTGNILAALAIASLPVLTFTGLLFYTDQLSLLAVLLTLLAQRSSQRFLAFICGCLACLIRQTNAVWLVFMIGEQAVQRLDLTHPPVRKSLFDWLLELLKRPVDTANAFLKAALLDAPHHTVTLVLCAVFVVFYNGGDIVLGDRSAHKPVLHIPQVFYFLVFCALHTPVAFVTYLQANLRIPGRNALLLFTIATAVVLAAIQFFTFEHPYLLADNRHYTFYVWSKFFRRYPEFRYSLAPIYVLCGDYVFRGLRYGSLIEVLTSLGFLAATALVLIPAGLLEPRYFITPYIIWRLSRPRSADVSEVLINALIIAATVYVFVYFPFKWISQPFTWQRFMW